jgi:RsiW-degrading membrane proteinase PrsW (M82 family)
MTNVAILIVASIGPGLLWLWYFYKQDRFEPEPLRMILKVFFMGILLVVPAGVLEQIWRPQIVNAIQNANWLNFLMLAFLVVALIEEGLKSSFLIWMMSKNHELDEPVDGIIYGITLGLGFASLENFLWASVYGYGVAAMRAVVTTLAHATFTGWMGNYVARYKLSAISDQGLLWKGFLLAWMIHGSYDFLLFLRSSFASLLAFGLIVTLLFRLYRTMQRLSAESPFRQ